jgi:hypothetical protein
VKPLFDVESPRKALRSREFLKGSLESSTSVTGQEQGSSLSKIFGRLLAFSHLIWVLDA